MPDTPAASVPPPASLPKPRRSHNKSRNGCSQCKQRKVKCGEEKPTCLKCARYGTACSFLQTHPLKSVLPTVQSLLAPELPAETSHLSRALPIIQPAYSSTSNQKLPTIQSMLSPEPARPTASSPASSSSTRHAQLPLKYTILDLELLHFYTTESVEGLRETDDYLDLFRREMVSLAYSHEFLMHEILSFAGLHLSLLRPEKRAMYMHASDSHAAIGLSMFQAQVSNISSENCHACFAFSTLIFLHTWAAQDSSRPSTLFFHCANSTADQGTEIQWVKLHRGSHTILDKFWPTLLTGPLAGFFAPWTDLPKDRDDPLPPEEAALFAQLSDSWTHSNLSSAEKTALDDASSPTRRVFSMMLHFPHIPRLSIVMAWFSNIPQAYLTLLEQKNPQAILIAIYYCVPLKSQDHLWWMRGKSQNLLRTLISVLPRNEGWERWTRWPMEKVLGDGRIEWAYGDELMGS